MMKILFTGASSFTGMWFVKALSDAGHKVTALLLRPINSYEGLKKTRIEILKQYANELIDDCPFGSKKFLNTLENEFFHVLCHHAAEVTNYKSETFDFMDATNKNTKNLQSTLQILKKNQAQKIILTGTVFEPREGTGDKLNAISPYGLSKGITSDIFEYFCKKNDLPLKKFVIANPFGPYEEERFTTYLIKKWINREKPMISYPKYVRDNIPITLLSKTYQYFVEDKIEDLKITPSCYVESVVDFTKRFSKEISKRLPLNCEFDVLDQTHYLETMTRYGIDSCTMISWNENEFWDKLAAYYKKFYLEVP